MHRGRTSRRLSEVSHLFLSDSTRSDIDAVESTVHVAVTGRGLCRAYIGSGLARAASESDLNVSLAETGLSLPNAGYYFGLEPEEYLSVYLRRTDSVSGMTGGALSISFSPRPAGLSGRSGSFASPGKPHLIINLFDSTSLTAGGAIPVPVLKIPELFHMEGKRAGGRDLLLVFTTGESGEDVPALVRSFMSRFAEGEVLLAGRFPKEYEETEYGMIELPGAFQEDLASRRLPSNSFFSGLASRVLASMSRGERRSGAAEKG